MRWAGTLGLIVVAAVTAGWWTGGWYGPEVPTLGLFAVAVAALTGLRRDELTRRPLGLDRVDVALLVMVFAVAVAWTGSWRAVVGLSSDEAMLVQTSGKPWLDAWTADKGLPSQVHGLLVAPALLAGGIGAILALHAALYAVFGVATLATLKRATSPGPARLAAVLLLLDPGILHQFQELRAYASFLTLMALAALALVPPADEEEPRWVPAVLALGLAALDLPIAGVPLAGVAAAAFLHALPGPRALLAGDAPAVRGLRAAVIVALGLSATVGTAMSVRAEPRPAVTWWLMEEPGIRAALAIGAASVAAGLLSRRTRPGAIAVLLGLVAIVRIWAGGTLLVKEKYVLFLLPMAVPTALAALGRPLRRLAPAGDWVALAVLVTGVIVGRHGGPVLDALDKVAVAPVDAALPKVALGGAVIGAVLLGRGGALSTLRGVLAGALVALALVDLGRTAWLERQWLRIDVGMRQVADLAVAEAAGAPICAPEAKVRLRLQAFALVDERPSWWSPLRRPRGDARGWHDRVVTTCPASGPHVHLHEEHGTEDALPDGCVLVARVDLSPADRVAVSRCGGPASSAP